IFESNANGLTGIITPIQETTRQTIQEVPSIETPKFEKYIQGFFSEAKNEIGAISAKVKGLDQNRKDLEKNIQSIIRTFNDYANNAKDKFEEQKTEALKKVDRMRMDRDKRISELSQLKESIDENAETLVKNLHTVIRNRKKLAKHSTFKLNRNAPTEVTLALYLVQLQEKGKARYFVIPPITFKQKGSETDYPTIYKNSAIQGEQKIMDKIAEELVFNRRLKDTFKTLKENNYVKSGEFKDAVKEGLKFLVSNKLLSKKLAKEINGFTSDINLR
ncbi:MAG: hypothetical protein U9O98_11130, partial [Asgard group archaeon]|nr:hypothetical protein [Asgard group archaeon]